MASIFTKIINRELPAHIVFEDEEFIAFLDIMPVAKGHTLLIPKQEIDYLFHCDDALLHKLMLHAKRIALALEKLVPCKKVGISVIGLEVPHTHLHLVPLNEVNDINFAKTKHKAEETELVSLASELRALLA